jgi:YD repeat-containing protein
VALASSGGATGSRTFAVKFSGPTTVAPVNLSVTATTASFAWNTTPVANGTYTLTLTVTDAAGATASASRSVLVSNAAPFTASITYPPNGATVSGNQSVGMSTTAPWGVSKTFTLSVDGHVLTRTTTTGTTLWFTWKTAGLSGRHTLALTVSSGTATATSSITVTVKK